MEGKEHWRNRLRVRVRIRRFESAQVRDALVLNVSVAAVQGDVDQRESLLVEQARVLGEAMFHCVFCFVCGIAFMVSFLLLVVLEYLWREKSIGEIVG